MICKTRTYNNGKAVTRDELNSLIQDTKGNGDWSRVEKANVSKITDMFCLFTGVEGIENLNLDGWDTSNVTNMGYMFYNSDYNHPLYLDTSKVINMDSMFYDSSYNHPLDFDTSNVEDMDSMFCNSDYNHPLDFDTSNVSYIRLMFCNSKYNHLLDFDTSNVEDMEGVFENSPITCPITFTGGNIPDDVQAFIDENNITYDEKRKLEDIIHNKCDTNEVVVAQSFKL